MAVKVKFSWCKLKRIEIHESNDVRYYNYYEKTEWEKIKTILNEFGIVFPSNYEVKFSSEKYQLEPVPEPFGTTKTKILYKGVDVAEATADGSNVCDTEGLLIVYIDNLKSVYTD